MRKNDEHILVRGVACACRADLDIKTRKVKLLHACRLHAAALLPEHPNCEQCGAMLSGAGVCAVCADANGSALDALRGEGEKYQKYGQFYYPPETIYEAAILTTGRSHAECLGKQNRPIQGFVTSIGRFVDRRDALRIATAAGQLNGRTKHHPLDQLMSEDLRGEGEK